jgi:hypothetical protein
MKIYMDNSVLNRPYDDQRQPRVWLETLCFVLILQLVETGEAELVRSAFHILENNESRANDRREWVEACLNLASSVARTGAESAAADFFITCDDQLIRKYRGPLRTLTPPELILILTKEQP